ncbi:MAG TPA: GH116 family glycosyl-hydrolase [Tepidisphaeraceae bacterium]|jgi:uncharacterized protein (DUF608 family)|nr:GH116 family glycosyl-hydrolase [Tepidisphaeraceae bacterium]
MNQPQTTPWPILRSYDRDSLARIAMPIGGIGTGTISLGGRGDLRDWENVNRPAKGFRPRQALLAVHARTADGHATTRALEGPLDASEYEGADGSHAANHGLPRFRNCAFHAAYPFGQVELSDPAVPVTATVEAFNPLVPGDANASGLPIAVLRVRLRNTTDQPLHVGVMAAMTNHIGADGTEGAPAKNVNTFRSDAGLSGLFMQAGDVPATSHNWGSLALTTPAQSGHHVSCRPVVPIHSWGTDLLDLWDDFSADGQLDDVPPGSTPVPNDPLGALAVSLTLAPGQSSAITFVLAWHFPNRPSWSPNGQGAWLNNGRCASGDPIIGNYYTTQFTDAWDAAAKATTRLDALERDTLTFVRAFCDSALPPAVKEAALFNLSTLRTQTCFRTPDGRLYGWEGVFERHGSCLGSCTHVWNYEQAVPFLFGDLARTMREVEFAHATRDDGLMSFRVHLPLEFATKHGMAAADGQMGCVMKLYREWKLSGDDAWLSSLWPKAKAALSFCWIKGGWDADRDGVMEGCQHNTMDVEYYGPNPQMQGWYLGALRAAEEMANHLCDDAFARECRGLFERGRAWMDEHLFNGQYYEHQVRPPAGPDSIADGLRHPRFGARDLSDPDFQLGAGCLVDQLVGQYMAKICGLGDLHDPRHVRTTLGSIFKHNRHEEFFDHFNPMRSYVLGDETALVMASYPLGRRPRHPFPYFNEVMTGFEYTAAVGMMQEGLRGEGLRVIEAIRARYDGRRRNPFDEAECGRHYARAMASWAAVVALTGFSYDARTASIRFAQTEQPATFFWSNGYAWGTFTQRPAENEIEATLAVLGGSVRVAELMIDGREPVRPSTAVVVTPGDPLTVRVGAAAGV